MRLLALSLPWAGNIHLAPLDLVGLALVVLLVILGLWRGLWWQVIRLLGIVAAVALARAFSPQLARELGARWADLPPRVVYGTAWLVIFLLALGAATLLGYLGQRLIDAMQLGFANRLGGALVGAVTGLLLHLALLVAIVQLATEDFVGREVTGTYSERLVHAAGVGFPVVLSVEAAEQVQRVLDKAPREGAPPAGDTSDPARASATPDPDGVRPGTLENGKRVR